MNVEDRLISSVLTLFTRLASRKECFEAFNIVHKEVLHDGVFVALVYLTSAALYTVLFNEAFCTDFFDHCTGIHSRVMLKLDHYRAELYNEVF